MSGDQRLQPHEHRPHRVYVLRDAAGAVLYVGSTSNATRRIADHRRNQPWRAEIDPGQTVLTDEMPWEAALEVEEECIRMYSPRHNVQQTNGTRHIQLGLRKYIATESRLIRAAKSGDPAAVAALDAWRHEQLLEAQSQMSSLDWSLLGAPRRTA